MPLAEEHKQDEFRVGDLVKINPMLLERFPGALPPVLRANGREIRVVETVEFEDGQHRPEGIPKPHPQLVAVSAGGMRVGTPAFQGVKLTFFSGSWFVPVSH